MSQQQLRGRLIGNLESAVVRAITANPSKHWRDVQSKKAVSNGVNMLVLKDCSEACDNRSKSNLLCAHPHDVRRRNRENFVNNEQRAGAFDICQKKRKLEETGKDLERLGKNDPVVLAIQTRGS